jgi:hypothetical protein
MKVAFVTYHWDRPDLSLTTHAIDVMAAARSAGIEGYPMSIPSTRDARFGGLIRPLLRRMFTAYPEHDGAIIHNVDPDSLRGVDVVTIHDLGVFQKYDDRPSDAFYRHAIRVVMKRAKRVIVTTEGTRRELTGLFPDYADKVRVVPVPHAPVSAARLHGRYDAEYDAMWLGRNAPNKRLVEYVELAKRFPGCHFFLKWSKSPGRQMLDEELVRSWPWPTNLHDSTEPLAGEALDTLYRKTRIYVATSSYEGWHRPPIEAYLRGCHVVLPRREPYVSIYPEQAAFWYDPNDRVSLDKAFIQAVATPNRPPIPSVYESVSYPVVGAKLKAVYEEVVRA